MGANLFAAATAACFVALYCASCANGTLQTITFYYQTHCSGYENSTINATENNLRASPITNATSIRALGVWVIYFENRTNDLERYSVSPSDSKPPLGNCVNVYELLDSYGVGGKFYNFKIYAAKRIGPADMATSQLVLYTGKNFTGIEYTIDKDAMIALEPRPVRIQSYAHFSNDTWTFFSKVGYNGTTEYLYPYNENHKDPRDDFAYRRDDDRYIGSIKKGFHEGDAVGKGNTRKIEVALFILSITSLFISIV